jgi:hypothetical protein
MARRLWFSAHEAAINVTSGRRKKLTAPFDVIIADMQNGTTLDSGFAIVKMK